MGSEQAEAENLKALAANYSSHQAAETLLQDAQRLAKAGSLPKVFDQLAKSNKSVVRN